MRIAATAWCAYSSERLRPVFSKCPCCMSVPMTDRKRKHADGRSSTAKKQRQAGKPSSKGAKHGDKAEQQKLSKREHKDLIKSKKLKFKKNYATIQETVLLWEQLRPKQTTKVQKEHLVANILKKLQGNIPELANHHSASRVIQWCLKEGSAADKAKLVAELRSNIVPLSKSKYGRHVVQKLINIASKQDVPGLVKLFKGHVAELLRHPSGADVLDDLYSVCPQSCRNTLCAELYGREFTLFDGIGAHSESISHLSQLLSGVNASKRQALLQHLYKQLAPVLEKALLHPAMTHRLLRELLTEAPGSIVADVVDTIAATGGNALKLVHTHDGAAAAAMALAYGTPKDRKRLVKGMKGYVWQTAENEWGHAVVATALSVVDDTALTSKVILSELKAKLDQLCTDRHAHHVLMQLLAPDSHRYLPPAIYELLHPPVKTMLVAADAPAAAGAGLDVADDEFLDEAAGDEMKADEAEATGSGDGFGEDQLPNDQENSDQQKDGQDQEQDQQGSDRADREEAAAEPIDDDGSNSSKQQQLVERQLGESKKATDVRRRELLESGKDSLAAMLLQLCSERAGELLRNQVSADVVVEVARGSAGGLLWQMQQAGVEAVHAAIVQQVVQGLSSITAANSHKAAQQEGKQQKKRKKNEQAAPVAAAVAASDGAAEQAPQEPLLTHFFASRALRRLLLAGSSEGLDGEGARTFAQQFWSQALQGQSKQLLGTHAEKVLAGLLHCGAQQVQQQVAAELQPLMQGSMQDWAAKFMGPADAGQRQQKAVKQQQQQVGKQQQQEQQQQQATAKQAATGRKLKEVK